MASEKSLLAHPFKLNVLPNFLVKMALTGLCRLSVKIYRFTELLARYKSTKQAIIVVFLSQSGAAFSSHFETLISHLFSALFGDLRQDMQEKSLISQAAIGADPSPQSAV